MTLKEYQIAVQRTMTYLGTEQLDILHMIVGLNSEINELLDAKDAINLSEELSDINFYLTNYCNLTGIDISEHFVFSGASLYNVENNDSIIELTCQISKLTNLEKRELAYKKKVDDGGRLEQVINIYKVLNDCFVDYSLDPNDSMQKNIDKLKARYPEKFTEEKALNRDLELERNILEGKLIVRN